MPARFLHLHSTFTLGGKEARAVRLMNAWGAEASHTVVSAMPGALAAREAIAPGIAVAFPDFPPLAGRPSLARLRAIAGAMRGHDLVLTYNWGAMDAVMAHRLFARIMALPPLVHHEDGFNADEANGQKPARVLWRRVALPTADAVIVPSWTLERIARRSWGRRRRAPCLIPNGVPVERFRPPPAADAIPGFARRPGELVIGTMAGLRAVKNLPRLVRAFAALPDPARLVIVGEGPERPAILAEAARLGVADRVHLPGFLPDPARYVGLFDIFALSSDSEQAPISLLEAMAAGLPALSTDVGDVARTVAAENRPFVVPASHEPALAGALLELAADPALRARIGGANRARATEQFDEAQMIRAYRSVYGQALNRLP
jgi:L-malate glycosyltransferase